MLRRPLRVLELSWKRLAVGAGLGLGVAALALTLATVATFQVAFNEHKVALVAYTILVVSTAYGAALALVLKRG